MRRVRRLIHRVVPVRLAAMYQYPPLVTLGVMRFKGLVILVGAVMAVSACSSSSSSEARSWESPLAMQGAVRDAGVLTLQGCSGQGVDITGGQKVTCFVGADSSQQVTFSTYKNEDAARSGAEYLEAMPPWYVHHSGSWVVAASDQATLDKAVSALS